MERHIYMAGSPFSNGFEVYENQINLVNIPDESGVPDMRIYKVYVTVSACQLASSE